MASSPTFDPNRFRDFPPVGVAQPQRAGSLRAGIDVQDRHRRGRTRGAARHAVADARLRRRRDHHRQHHHPRARRPPLRSAVVRGRDRALVERRHGARRPGARAARASTTGSAASASASAPACRCPAKRRACCGATDKWTQVSPASISIGQEIGVTPLQIDRARSPRSRTGGLLVEPRIVERVVDDDGKTVVRAAAARAACG